jgi:hypothetical protein
MKQLVALASLAIFALAATPMAHAAQSSGVIVNRAEINADQLQALEYFYGPIDDGKYWYDQVSGLWGAEGGPAVGQIAPGLSLGGALRSDASNGSTGVFFNGRQLHASEVDLLRQRFGVVYTGRYWLRADGVGGPEGGPALFSLATTAGGSSGGSSGGNDFYYGGTIDRGYGGTYGSDGSCFYISVDGGDVMGPGC